MTNRTTKSNNIMEHWQGRMVEGLYLPVAMVAVAVRTSLIDPKSNAITNAILDWFDRKAALEREGESITCMCCRKPLAGKTMVGGFVIMIPVEVGGFDAANEGRLPGWIGLRGVRR